MDSIHKPEINILAISICLAILHHIDAGFTRFQYLARQVSDIFTLLLLMPVLKLVLFQKPNGGCKIHHLHCSVEVLAMVPLDKKITAAEGEFSKLSLLRLTTSVVQIAVWDKFRCFLPAAD